MSPRHRARSPHTVGVARWLGAVLSAAIITLVAVGPGAATDTERARPGRAVGSAAAVPATATPTVPVVAASPTAVAGPAPAASAGGPTAASAGARASGLPWSSGVFSHKAARGADFATRRGRPVDVLAVFPTRDSWDTLMGDWWMGPTAVPDGFTGTLAVGLPLFPTDGSMAAAARGDDEKRWRAMGELIASRHPDAWVRIGWEMNIPNWPWAATPANVESYKQAFRHAATGLRAGGPNLRIVFNPNEGVGSLPDARAAYPGDEYVDDIGLDAYDWDPAYTPEGWEKHRTGPGGWDFWATFARERGKTFSVPEWGVIPGSSTSGGDNAGYITSVMTWMGENADIMSFDAYFDETADYCRCALSLNPAAQRAYIDMMPRLAALGPARPSAARAPTRVARRPEPSTRPGVRPGPVPTPVTGAIGPASRPAPNDLPEVRVVVVPAGAGARNDAIR